MGECPKLEKCPFFNNRMANMPSVSEWLKEQYCRKGYDTCARYQAAEALGGAAAVPIDLFLNQKQRAIEVIDKSHWSERGLSQRTLLLYRYFYS